MEKDFAIVMRKMTLRFLVNDEIFFVNLRRNVIRMSGLLQTTEVLMEILFLFLGNRERPGMDVDDVKLQMRLIRESHDRYTDDKQLHHRIALRAMIRWHLKHWSIQDVFKLSISDDPMALITGEREY